MKKVIVLVVAVLLLAGSLTACAGKGSESTPAPSDQTAGESSAPTESTAPQELKTIRTATLNGGIMTVAVLLGEEKGWFAGVGLKNELVMFPNGVVMMEALPANEWDVGLGGVGGTLNGIINRDLKVIAYSTWDDYAVDIYARPDSDIAQAGAGSIEGYPDIYGTTDLWRDKTLILPVGSTAHLMAIRTLNAMGLTGDDVNIIGMDISSGLTAFNSGEGDLLTVWSPSSYLARHEGYVPVSSATAVGMRPALHVYANPTYAESNNEDTRNWLDVYLRASEYANENVEEAAQIYYDFCVEGGITALTMEDCIDFVGNRPTPTLAEQYEIFKPDADGLTQAEADIVEQLDFFISQGNYQEADKAKVRNGINPSFITALYENK